MSDKIELLAPAGSFESLNAAIDAGCDSVYFGVDRLNMRQRSANNFSLEKLNEVTGLCRDRGIRSYLTLNTLLYDEDLAEMRCVLESCRECGVDGVIISDPAALEYAAELGLSIHISTQLSVSNYQSVRYYARVADVIVLARELDLPMIREISRQIREDDLRGPSGKPMVLEIFGHGALCLSQSGRCTMSLFQHNCSANRGECLQTCRASYRITNCETGEELRLEHPFVLSPRDICTVGILDRIRDAGVNILKIEGRARDPLYVSRVTTVYREALDSLADGSYTKDRISQWNETLTTVFNRGLSEGYYLGRTVPELSGVYGSHSRLKKVYYGKVSHYYPKQGVAEFELVKGPLKIDDQYVVIGPTSGVVEGSIDSLRDDGAEVTETDNREFVTFKVSEKVRKNDQLYLIKEKAADEL